MIYISYIDHFASIVSNYFGDKEEVLVTAAVGYGQGTSLLF